MTTEPLVLQPDVDPRGLKGLPPFVDVVYGAVLGFGVFKIEEAIEATRIPGKGNQTALFLSVLTSIYLVFDYANTRMCIEKYPYRSLMRFTIDIFSAIAFVFAYVAGTPHEAGAKSSPYYLLWLAVLLLLGAFWIVNLDSEHPDIRLPRILTYSHIAAAMVLVLFLFFELSGTDIVHRWIIPGGVLFFLLYSFVLSLLAYFSELTDLERGLLPIIPIYALIEAFYTRKPRK